MYLKIIDHTSNISRMKTGRRGYILYSLLGFEADPAEMFK